MSTSENSPLNPEPQEAFDLPEEVTRTAYRLVHSIYDAYTAIEGGSTVRAYNLPVLRAARTSEPPTITDRMEWSQYRDEVLEKFDRSREAVFIALARLSALRFEVDLANQFMAYYTKDGKITNDEDEWQRAVSVIPISKGDTARFLMEKVAKNQEGPVHSAYLLDHNPLSIGETHEIAN